MWETFECMTTFHNTISKLLGCAHMIRSQLLIVIQFSQLAE